MPMPGLEGTAIPGSDPGTGQTPDSPTGPIGATPAPPDAEMDENGKPLPFNEHPKWKSARNAEKELGKILADNELDSIEDLLELVQSGKAVVGKGLTEDQLDGLMAKAKRMEEVEEYWETQKEAQRRAEEDPDETAARLEKENAELKRKLSGKNEADASRRVLETFGKIVDDCIDVEFKDAAKEERKTIKFLLGVDHPFGEIDINNKSQVAKMTRQVKKVMEEHDQRVIKDFVDGKKSIPKIGSTATPAAPSGAGIKDLKGARNFVKEHFRNYINQ